MGINGIIDRKLAVLDDTLTQLKAYVPDAAAFSDFQNDWGLQKIVERSLQILVESMIDIAERIIAVEKRIPPTSSAAAIETIQQMDILSKEDVFIDMVRFRNYLVHNYDRLDETILFDMICHKLHYFELFRNDIINYQNR